MIRPPLGKLHHYESHTDSFAAWTVAAAKLEQLNRGGAIRFTGELTPAAHCGSALIEIERLHALLHTLRHIGNQWSRLCYTPSPSPILPPPTLQPLYPVLRPHRPGTIGRGQKINASLQPAFHQLRGSRFRENADGLIRQPLGNRYWGAFNAVEYSSLFSMSIESLLTLHDRYRLLVSILFFFLLLFFFFLPRSFHSVRYLLKNTDDCIMREINIEDNFFFFPFFLFLIPVKS